MLYVINGKYYMLRNREYVQVDVELKDNELSIKPNRENVIEINDDVKAKSVLTDELIENLKEDSKKEQYLKSSTYNRKNKFDL